jgi:hypothetical protein
MLFFLNKYLKVSTTFGLAALCCSFGKATYPDTRYESTNNSGVSSEFRKIGENEGKRDDSVRLLSDVNAAIEVGVRIPGKAVSFSVYLSQQDDFDVFRFGRGTQTLLGIRLRL